MEERIAIWRGFSIALPIQSVDRSYRRCLACFSNDSHLEVRMPERRKAKNRDLEIAPTGNVSRVLVTTPNSKLLARATKDEESRPGDRSYRKRLSCFSDDSKLEIALPVRQKTKNRDLEIAPTENVSRVLVTTPNSKLLARATKDEESRPGDRSYRKRLSCFSNDSHLEVRMPERQKAKNRDLEIAPTGDIYRARYPHV